MIDILRVSMLRRCPLISKYPKVSDYCNVTVEDKHSKFKIEGLSRHETSTYALKIILL